MSTQNESHTIESLQAELDINTAAIVRAKARVESGEAKSDSYVKRLTNKQTKLQAALDAMKLDVVQSGDTTEPVATNDEPVVSDESDDTTENVEDEREYHVYAIEKLKGDGKTWKPVGERVSHSANGALRRYGIRNGRKGIGKSRSGRRFRALNTGVAAENPALATA